MKKFRKANYFEKVFPAALRNTVRSIHVFLMFDHVATIIKAFLTFVP